MRNVAARKLRQPKAYKALRRIKGEKLIPFTNQNGRITYLNAVKHLMLNRPYVYPEYQETMVEFARQQFKMKQQKETYAEKQVDKEIEKEDNKETKKEEADA